MDVKLPGENGVESFLEIRKFKPDAKVTIMTGYSVSQLLDQALENGAWAVMHKPLNIDKILEMINKISSPGVILLVDDDPDVVESIKDMLERRNYAVAVARDGQKAVEIISSNGIDVLILDLYANTGWYGRLYET